MTTLGAAVDANTNVFEFGVPITIPADYPARYTVDSETVYVTGGSGTRFLQVRRGQEDTLPASHAVNATFTSAPAGSGGGGSGVTVTESATDPGAIGAGNFWVRLDPDQTWPPVLYVRNAANTDWSDETGSGNLLGLTSYDDNDLIRAILYTYPGQIQGYLYDDAGTQRAGLQILEGGISITSLSALGAIQASLALDSDGATIAVGAHKIRVTSTGAFLDNNPFAQAAHVADGSTVDQLRDALIASGLMAG